MNRSGFEKGGISYWKGFILNNLFFLAVLMGNNIIQSTQAADWMVGIFGLAMKTIDQKIECIVLKVILVV